MSKIGRNDACPCGSGKKYKKCCLAQSYASSGREDATREKIIDDILVFCIRHYKNEIEDGIDRFWGGCVPTDQLSDWELESADINFWEWIAYDWKPSKEKTLIDIYLKKKKLIAQDDISMLQKMKRATLTLFEIQDVFPDQGFILKDLLLGGEYDVKEKMATRGLNKWDIFAGRILHTDGSNILTGSLYPYLMSDKNQLLKQIKNAYKKYKKTVVDADMQGFLKNMGHLFNHIWVDYLLNPPQPELVNASGEPLLISKATYGIKDKIALIAGLHAIDRMEKREEDQFIWLDKEKDGESSTILGTVVISGKTLTLETNSKERLKKIKTLIDQNVSNATNHKVDSYQDPYQAMEASKDLPAKVQEEKIPFEIQQELYKNFMDKHYKDWINDKIPALKNKTPLEAINTPAGKKKVIDILKSIENNEEKNQKKGHPTYDITWLWEKLDLKRK